MRYARGMNLRARTSRALDWPVVLRHLARHARTVRGKDAAESLRLADTRAEAQRLYAVMAELRALEDDEEVLPIGAVTDIREPVERARHASSLEGTELRDIGTCLLALDTLRRWLDRHAEVAPELHVAAAPLQVDQMVLEELVYAFEDDGALSGVRFPKLADLRTRIEGTRSSLRQLLRDLVSGDQFGDMLQDRFVTERNGRFVIPVKPSYARSIGIVHAASQSGETLFVEPAEVVERTNKLKELEHSLEREERRILVQLTRLVSVQAPGIDRSLQAAEELDLLVARHGLGCELNGVLPEVGGGGVIRLKAARHPVLQLRGVDVVANDLTVDGKARGLVISGPNTGGKTVALKTLGLAALFVRAGIPVPAAEGSRVDVFSPVLADVGDSQTVEGDLSTFSGHVEVLKAMLRQADHRSLVLLDEIGVGTDPAQGAALARAVLEALVASGARVGVTTHYAELKALGSVDTRFSLAAVQYADGRPTYRVQAGLAGQSHALAIASRLELPPDVVSRARDLMETTSRELTELMEDVESAREEAVQRNRELAELRRELLRQRRRLEQREETLEARRKKLKEEVARRFRERLRAREAEVKALIAKLQANPDLRLASEALASLRGVKAAVDAEIRSVKAPLPPPPREVEVGDSVVVRHLGKVGQVTRALGRDRFEVRVGKLPMQVKKKDLAPADGEGSYAPPAPAPAAPAPAPAPAPPADGPAVRLEDNTLDLRGLRVDSALDRVDHFVARLIADRHRVGFVLHGHGTGALKKAVRSSLPQHPHVRRWRPANPDEGGDAYTIVQV